MLRMFSRINYYIVGNDIDSIDNSGVATVIKGIILFNDNLAYYNASGE